jgi:hypothetical protein
MKYRLVYEQGLEIKQYRNLREWLELKGIKYSFEHNNGKYIADTVVIEDEQDSVYFSLTFTHATKVLI